MAVNRVTAARAAMQDTSPDDVREVLRLLVSVVTGLKRGRDEVPHGLREAFEGGGLGPRHVPVLMTVGFDGPLSVSEIAERIGLSLATTSLMVGELDRHGLVERAEDERDRRRTMVRLPEAYRALVDGWAQTRYAPVARALERLSPGARRHFMEGLAVLAEESSRALAADVSGQAPEPAPR
jgi:DNA-binding MarR family transcriptional regulator